MIKIEIENLDKLIKDLEKYPAISIKYTNKAIASALTRIKDEATQNTPIGASGRLKASWYVKMGQLEGSLRNVMQEKGGRFYGYDVEKGREPFYISPQDIGAWAKKKNLNPYAVSKSISRKGTKANPFFEKSIRNVEDGINKDFDEALENITKEL
jgi:hypothetical protein